MSNKRARMTAEEVDFICKLRNDGKTHKDFNTATGRDNYLFRLKPNEFIILETYRTMANAKLPIAETDYQQIVADKKEAVKDKRKESQIKGQIDYLLKRNAVLEDTLAIKEATANVEIYELKPLSKSSGKETVSISLFSDFHCDEVVLSESVMGLNEYNPAVAKKRADNYFINLVKLINHHQKNYVIKRHIIGMLGDNIGGFIHEELRQTNSMTPMEGISFAKSVILSGFKYLQDNLEVDSIDVVCIVGNHARTTDKLPFANLTETSYEYFMYKDIEEMCKLIGLTKFNFIIPKASMAILTIFGKKYGFVHGIGFKFLGGIGGLYIP